MKKNSKKVSYSNKNAKVVLRKVNALIKKLEDKVATCEYSWLKREYGRVRMDDVYDELSIFDWWVDYLSISKLKDMKSFLEEAIKLGYKGYVCFKVGATGCANGMWAHIEESKNGYSPDGKYLYKSFTPAYNYWSFSEHEDVCKKENKDWNNCYDELKTKKMLEAELKKAA